MNSYWKLISSKEKTELTAFCRTFPQYTFGAHEGSGIFVPDPSFVFIRLILDNPGDNWRDHRDRYPAALRHWPAP